jgi:GNAT superfamily N-acetyltransferase
VTGLGLTLRPATIDDAALVANLETARTPDDPHDGAMVAFWWTHEPGVEKYVRLAAERDGAIQLLIEANHNRWEADAPRFGWARVSLHPAEWTERVYRGAMDIAESWLRSAGCEVSVANVREDFDKELAVLEAMGYREVRRQRYWELDLVAHRDQLLAAAEQCRADMRRQGISLLTLDLDPDPGALKSVYELDLKTSEDIPTTVPLPVPTYEEWVAMYFENPGILKGRFWVARMGDSIVGMSLIEYPPGRGVPSTEYTAVSRSVRGRGIGRALKYETVAQAIALGATRLRTDNDAENAPILRINAEMGYRPTTPHIELHRHLPVQRASDTSGGE